MAVRNPIARAIGVRVAVWVALVALLTLTVALTFAPLGPFRLAASLVIAAAKAGLIVWIYMGLSKASGITRLAAGSALVLLTILFALTGADFAARA
jgi:cytochrome c oxidase subunit 4